MKMPPLLVSPAGRAFLIVWFVMSVTASLVYPGSFVVAMVFSTVFAATVLLIAPAPRAHAYTFLAIFLFLGFWVKFVAFNVVGFKPIEPLGDFSGTSEQWSRALVVAAMGGAGLVAARLLHLYFARRRPARVTAVVPSWFVRFRSMFWIAFAAVYVAVHGWNAHAAIYRIGMVTTASIPALDAILAWLITSGLGMAVAVLVEWELASARARPQVVLAAPALEALLSSASTLSRSMFLVRILPYIAVLADRGMSGAPKTPRARMLSIVTVATLFVVSIIIVTAARVLTYPPTTGPPPPPKRSVKVERPVVRASIIQVPFTRPAATQRALDAVEQLGTLFIGRWLGLDGVLVVAAHEGVGPELLGRALVEDPRAGNGALYQQIARASYKKTDRYVFLTIPGLIAFLYLGGSLVLVFAGTLLAAVTTIAFEEALIRATGLFFLPATVGILFAYMLSNFNFPYLALVYAIEQVVACAVFAMFYRWSLPRTALR